jgi:GTP-binding protein HflX
VENKLFATLDATSRKLPLSDSFGVVLTDTVGFIRKLPHDLVDAFHSTLEETVLADFLVHVVDAANPSAEEHHRRTLEVLDEIGAKDKPIITVLNKVDLVDDETRLRVLESSVADGGPCIRYSSQTGAGADDLRNAIERLASGSYTTDVYHFPPDRHDLVALTHRNGRVLEQEYRDTGVVVSAQLPEQVREQLRGYRRTNDHASRTP